MQPLEKPSSHIPTSVVDFQRSASSAGGGLHFRYDMAAVAAAAADEVATKLREDGARLTRKLGRAQAEGQRLLSEVDQAHGENKRLALDLSVVQAQSMHHLVLAQKEREARAWVEERLKDAQNANKSLQIDLEVAKQALETERTRTARAAESATRLRRERNALKKALAVSDYLLLMSVADCELACSFRLNEQGEDRGCRGPDGWNSS